MMKHRPIELQIKLHDEVRRLREQGLSYRGIIDEIERMYGGYAECNSNLEVDKRDK